jgi:hypothetical protein
MSMVSTVFTKKMLHSFINESFHYLITDISSHYPCNSQYFLNTTEAQKLSWDALYVSKLEVYVSTILHIINR